MQYFDLSASVLTLFVTVFLLIFATTDGYQYYFGYPATYRTKEDSVKRAVYIVDPSQQAKTAGIITGWNVYTTRGRRSQVAQLQIWRPTGPMRYSLVGQTIFVAQWVGHNYVPIKPEFRIHIEPGDVIGLYFPKFNPVPWSPVPCVDRNAHIFRRNPKNLAVGVEYLMSKAPNDWNPCRQYSVNATVMDVEDSHIYTHDDDNSAMMPNNRGQHGDYFPTRRPSSSGTDTFTVSSLLSLLGLTALLHFNTFHDILTALLGINQRHK